MAAKSIEIKIPANHWAVPVKVLPEDMDELGHVNNVIYLRYVQEVAGSHWKNIAQELRLPSHIWVVGRHEIDYRHSILPGQDVLGITWVHAPNGMRFDRSVWLVNPEKTKVFAQAKTTWLLLDKTTGRPIRIGEELMRAFAPWMAE